MNEIVEALRERVAEIREQAALGRMLEKRARELTAGIEEKIRELENRMDEQKHALEYSARSAERAQKKYSDLQLSALEKRLKRLEEVQAAEFERTRSEYLKMSGATRELERKFGGEKAGIFRRISELNRNVSRIALENARKAKSRELRPRARAKQKSNGSFKSPRSGFGRKSSVAPRKRYEKIRSLHISKIFGRRKIKKRSR